LTKIKTVNSVSFKLNSYIDKELAMYERILVLTDGSDTSQRGIDEAVKLALVAGSSIRFFHAVDDQSFAIALQSGMAYAPNWRGDLRDEGNGILARAKATAAAARVPCDGVLSEDFTLSLERRVVAECIRYKADLIVIGTHGRRGIPRLLLGSSAEAILREAPVPVLLVRADPENLRQSIQAPTEPATSEIGTD
jgi:nucleotide-binding universal stress UspA family protein